MASMAAGARLTVYAVNTVTRCVPNQMVRLYTWCNTTQQSCLQLTICNNC